MTFELELPIRIVSEANRREHWRTKSQRTKAHRLAARLTCIASVGWPRVRADAGAGGVAITLTRRAPRRLDDDNLASGFKATRDGVADALGVDDGDARLAWSYAQQPCARYGIRIEIAPKEKA